MPTNLKISERQQVAAIILVVIGILVAAWILALGRLQKDIKKNRGIRESLAARYKKAVDTNYLFQVLQNHRAVKARMKRQWSVVTNRLGSFTDEEHVLRASVGKIDYKVELLNERRRLAEKSEKLGIDLIPTDLGMADQVLKRNNAFILMRKLRTVEKLADLTLDKKIDRLIEIEPLRHIRHHQPGNTNHVYYTEYPIELEFDITLSNLYVLFRSVMEEDQVFVFRRLRINAGATVEDPLRVNAVMSSLIFGDE